MLVKRHLTTIWEQTCLGDQMQSFMLFRQYLQYMLLLAFSLGICI